jgi:lipopolysaccharide export system protein LptC
MEKKLLATLIVIPLLSLAFTWLVINQKDTEKQSVQFPGQVSNKKIADAFFNQATINDFNETGTLKSKIIGQQIYHFPGEEDSEIIQPRVTFFRDEGSPVLISADHGWINKDGTRVLLRGHSVITREKSEFNQFMKLESPELIIWPDKEYIETDKAVKINSDSTVATGIGMKAYLDKEHYLLLNKVRSRHMPSKQ